MSRTATSPRPDRTPSRALATLVRAAARGHAGALAALARRVQPLVEAQARGVLRGRRGPEADELVAEVAAEVQAFLATGVGDGPGWRRFDAGRPGVTLEGWLYGIVRNKTRRRLRDARRAECASEELRGGALAGWTPEPPSPERAVDAARALRLVATLPERERDALTLWMHDEPSREIAARLRFASPHAVDCCLARSRQRLRALLQIAA